MIFDRTTKGQAYYLYYIGGADRREQTVTGLAKRMGVTAASASGMVSNLEKQGLVEREGRKLMLTAEGRRLIKDIRNNQQLVRRWMARHGLSPEQSLEEDSINYLLSMSKNCIEATLVIARGEETDELLRLVSSTELGNYLPDGEYEADFTLYKAGGKEISMGNQGFYHPAVLTVFGGKGLVTLKAKTITYLSAGKVRLSGRLSALAYWDGQRYQPVKTPLWYESWRLPLAEPEVIHRGDSLLIAQNMTARSSCGVARMPESEALLVLEIEKFLKFS
ncbi:MAG: NEAT domain-containing protein [Peptococcaceae bacterium]|nr:NEAT domain-containing protein [Peptococcaceae bacterium]